MIRQVIRYSAVTAKARAMYGKSLSDEAFDTLCGSTSLRQIWELLSRVGAWADVARQPRCASDEETFRRTLRELVDRDIRRLCLYLKERDRETLLRFLDRPTDGSVPPEEARAWWLSGGVKHAGLRRIAGAEADGLNLVFLLRLRRFPASASRAGELLIPVRDKLTPELVRRLLAAETDADVLRLLEKTPWGGVFRSLEPGELERQYGRYMAAFCRRTLAGARPGLTAVQAFITLREMECEKLCRLVGAAARGLDARAIV